MVVADPVLVISALAREQTLLAAAMEEDDQVGIARLVFHTGTIDGRSVVTAAAGVGKVNAAMVATLGMTHFGPSAVVVTGVAGGLDDSLGIGDVVIADHVVHHDAGVHTADGFVVYQAGHVPFFNPTDRLGYRPSAPMLDRARSAAAEVALAPVLERTPRVVVGSVVTGDQYVDSAEVRHRLRRAFTAVAVEMEGAAVAQVAERLGVDWLLIRALSDLAGGGASVDFTRFLDEVSANSAAVVRRLLAVL